MSTLQKGDIFYDSWGYDQTNIDFAQVVSLSPSGKTVLCRMMGKQQAKPSHRGYNPITGKWETCASPETCKVHGKHTSNTALVEPTTPYGIVFRMRADSGYHGEKAIKGSYPFVQIENHPSPDQRVHKRLGYFSLYTEPVYETPAGMGH